MHPHTPAVPGMPTEPLPIAQVNTGMTVVDTQGKQIGTVSAVQMPDTDVRPDAPAGTAEHLMSTGYLRVAGTGLLASDSYVAGDQVAEVAEADGGVVTLAVHGDALYRAD
jgi:hypothetical protein